ncbi:MAG: hypothetical protein IJ242_08105 [Clostridia bacterium]|nr:hypothetical protein [Clostridia bacterium]
METISWEDDNFIEELLDVVQLFRPFSVSITEFITEHGYDGDSFDTGAKVAFIRAAFEKAGMDAPREVREWFTVGQPIKRDTAFLICFAFGLDGSETDEFFRRYYARERSFNCHRVQEAVYYFCLNNGLSYAEALDIQARIPLTVDNRKSTDVVYTGSIIADLNEMETKEELISYLTVNNDKFSDSNVTAYEMIRHLWESSAGSNGLLLGEREKLPSMLDDAAFGKKTGLRAANTGVRPWDAYLAIFQLDKKDVRKLETDRTIKPIIEKLHADAQDSFPDRQGIELILHGKHVSYERVRKWLVLLTFYTFWAGKAVKLTTYEAKTGDAARCISHMNQMLIDAGYPEMYVGNPYDWIFLYAAQSSEPLTTFRYIWNELLTTTLEEHQ